MKFYIKQKVISLKDRFNVYDENQNVKYTVKGKYFSLLNKLKLLDEHDELIYHAEKRLFRLLPKYIIFDTNHRQLATIKKQLAFTPRYEIFMHDKKLYIDGTFLGHNFTLSDENGSLASIHKKYISWGDTYEIDIFNETYLNLILFIVIVIDQTLHERKH